MKVLISSMLAAVCVFSGVLNAQQAPAPTAGRGPQAGRGGRGGRGPAIVSPEVLADKRVTFRINAPRAETVTLDAADIPGISGANAPKFAKSEAGIWEATVGPVPPGAYRYVFSVDGVRVLDPVNPKISESNAYSTTLFYVPGTDWMDNSATVPHGAVATVHYPSKVLKTMRRMHVYTPPGYETNQTKYPVFYLLHGAQDTDDSWTSIGRAGFILDNLIAAKKVKPMVVVMPAGHQPAVPGAAPAQGGIQAAINPFTDEFVNDIMPYAETHYRVLTDRSHRAIAGLSMGGSQTLDIAFLNLEKFTHVGVFSSGASLGGGRGASAGDPMQSWETRHQANLGNAALKKGLKVLWLATGKDDGLIANTRTTTELLKKHGFNPVFVETPGAHTWLVWRDYLAEFTPMLFQ